MEVKTQSGTEKSSKHPREKSHEKKTEELEALFLKGKKRLLPKKGEHRMRAHINPFNATPFP